MPLIEVITSIALVCSAIYSIIKIFGWLAHKIEKKSYRAIDGTKYEF